MNQISEQQVVYVRLADWSNPSDGVLVVALLDAYARDPMGGNIPLSNHARDNLANAMASMPGAFSAIGYLQDKPVALANCFTTLSTFSCKPLINIHDLAVLAEARHRGVGQQMLSFVEAEAHRRGACKITLEVLSGNSVARRSYERFGFQPYALDEITGHALFMQKVL